MTGFVFNEMYYVVLTHKIIFWPVMSSQTINVEERRYCEKMCVHFVFLVVECASLKKCDI